MTEKLARWLENHPLPASKEPAAEQDGKKPESAA